VDAQAVIGVIAAVASVLAAILAFVGTRGKTKSDAKTAMDQRIDAKMATYVEKLEERLDSADQRFIELRAVVRAQEEEIQNQANTIDAHEHTIRNLREHAKRSNRREKLMIQYVRELRDHILNQLPPPPPLPPAEIEELLDLPDEDTEPA